MNYYLAQVLSLIACLMLSISCKQKTQKRVMIIQSCETTISIIAVLLLGGYTGVIVLTVALIRNILVIIDKTSKTSTAILVIISILLSIINAKTILDILPAIASAEYTIALYKKDVKITKIAFAINAALWGIYKATIGAWVYVAFNIVNVAICIYEISKLKSLSPK